MTSIRSPASTSLTSWMLRSWPTASGVSVSGSGTVSRSGRTGSVGGQRPLGADVDDVLGVGLVGDLDHRSSAPSSRASPGTSIGTLRRVGSGRASGSSTRRMPSR